MQPIDWNAVAALIQAGCTAGLVYMAWRLFRPQKRQAEAEAMGAEVGIHLNALELRLAEEGKERAESQRDLEKLRARFAERENEREKEKRVAEEREKELREEVETLRTKVKDLEDEVEQLRRENEQLRKENKQLKARLADLEKRPAGAMEGEKPKETEDK